MSIKSNFLIFDITTGNDMCYMLYTKALLRTHICMKEVKWKRGKKEAQKKTSAVLSAIDDDYSVEKNMKRKESELPKRYGRKGRNGIGDDVMMGENIFFLLLLFSFFFYYALQQIDIDSRSHHLFMRIKSKMYVSLTHSLTIDRNHLSIISGRVYAQWNIVVCSGKCGNIVLFYSFASPFLT